MGILNAQNKENESINYDWVTYVNYLQSDWDKLIDNSKEAIQKGAETANIRKRLGYAYFMKKNFFKSIFHYQKVYKQNSGDVDAKLMLYKNYKLIARDDEARFFSGLFSKEEKGSFYIPEDKLLTSIDGNVGISANDNLKRNSGNKIRNNQLYGVQQLNGNLYFWQGGAKYNLNRKVSLYFSYSGLEMDRLNQVESLYPKVVRVQPDFLHQPDNVIRVYNIGDSIVENNEHIWQHQLYLNTSFILNKLGKLNIFGNYIYNKFQLMDIRFTSQRFITTTWNNQSFPFNVVSVLEHKTHTSEYLVGTSYEKQFHNFRFACNLIFSNLNSFNQKQGQFIATWYPLGNTNLSFTSQLTYLKQQKENRLLPFIDITFKYWKYGWLSLNGVYGDLSNTSENNGMLIHNTSDKTIYRVGATLYFPINTHFTFYTGYLFSQKQSFFTTFTDSNNYQITWNNYYTQIIPIGLTLKL